MASARQGKVIPLQHERNPHAEELRAILDAIWHDSGQDEQTGALLTSILRNVNAIEHLAMQQERAISGLHALLAQVRTQRDEAIRQRDQATTDTSYWRRRGDTIAREAIVSDLAQAMRIDEQEVRDALLAIDHGEYTSTDMRDLKASLRRIGRNLDL